MANLPYISPDVIAQYQQQLAQTSTLTTAKRKMASLKKFFDWAHDKGHIKENPLTAAQPLSTAFEAPKRRKIGIRAFVGFGILAVSLLLIFLLTQKLQIPIPFLRTPASENGVLQLPQPTGNLGQATTPPTANTPTSTLLSPWTLFTKMTLKDASGAAILSPQAITFRLYKSTDDPTALWTSDTKQETPDTNGHVTIALDNVPTNVFFGNDKLYLGATIGGTEIKDRIPVSSANTASNLQGYTPASPTQGAGPGQIPVIADDGSLLLATEAPSIKAKQGNLLIEGQTVTLATPRESNGNIEVVPGGFGYAHFFFEGTGQNFLNAQAPNLTSGSLYYGMVPNNATGYDLLRLQSGSTLVTRFSVDARGNTNQTGNLSTSNVQRLTSGGSLTNITGYSQTSGNFTITQNPGDFASISKTGTALSDVLTLALDERPKPQYPNSGYNTLVLNRYYGTREAMALLVKNGNAQFNGQVRIGNFATTPTTEEAIGAGSIIYKTTDTTAYLWNGTAWVALGGGSSSGFWQRLSGILSPLTSTDSLAVGGTTSSAPFYVNGTSGSITTAGNLSVNGNTTLGDTSGDTVTANAASWTFANNTNFTLSGGVNGLSFDTTTLSIDATNHRVGIGKTSPSEKLDVAGNLQFSGALMPNSLAGTSGYVLTSQGAGVAPVWTASGGLGVKWNSLQNPDGPLTLSMGTNTTAFNWITGTSTNNLFSFTTDALANGTGSLVNIQTGASSTVLPLRVRAGSVEGLNVNASGNVGVGNASPVGKLDVSGAVIGKALAIFNETGDQNILTASASGVTKLNITRAGDLVAQGQVHPGNFASNPTTVGAGSIYYNTTDTNLYFDKAGTWTIIGTGAGGGGAAWTFSDPYVYTTSANYQVGIGTVTTGDIKSKLYVTNDGTLTGHALAIFRQTENQDIITASASAVTKFVVSKNGDVTNTGFLQVGAAWTPGTIPATGQAYSRFGNAIPDHFGGTPTASQVIFSDKTEFRNTIFLDSANGAGGGFFTIADYNGTGAIIFPTDPTTTPHELTAGNWMITNPSPTGNVGQAALIVNQQMGGDIFTASSSGVAKFIIANNGNVTISGSGTMLTVGSGTGKIDVGTVDPVYNIGGTRYATYLTGMTGVKEETTGNVTTNEYVPGEGYRHSIDFKDAQNGSDLWLFSKTTNLKNNIGKMVVLLSPSQNTRAWYDIDTQNYVLSIYTSRPATVSYRLTAPRFDYSAWSNLNSNEGATGFDIKDENLAVNPNGDVKPPAIPSLADFEIVPQPAVSGIQYTVYSIRTKAGQIIDELGAFGNLAAANIKAGIVDSQLLIADSLTAVQSTIGNLTISNKLVSPLANIDTVRIHLISPLPDQTDVAIQIGSSATAEGQLVIQNASGSAVASVDETGNATFAGTINSQQLAINNNASVGGTLYADKIKSTTLDDIQNLLHQVQQDQNLLSQAATWSANTATGSAVANIQNLFVTNQAAINSLSVSTSITVGTDLVFQSTINNQLSTISNSINTLSAPLRIQSLAMAPIEMMAGKFKIATNGDVEISGNLYVAGVVESSGFTVRPINNQLSTISNSPAASINASGSATFNSVSADKFILAAQAATQSADINGTITTNATAGQAIINAGVTEITIKNPSISDYTLVYVTPTSSTLNNVLYVKSKGAGFFTVGFSNPINVDVTFNWWVIDVKN